MACEMGKIRIGSMGDGGYVLPDDLANIDHLLSIGIGQEVSFDLFFAESGVAVSQYDHTVDGPPIQHPQFRFNKIAWSHEDSATTLSLSGMMAKDHLQASNRMILKFDTEGAEWPSLLDTPVELLRHFRIIVCELHALNNLANADFLAQVKQVLMKLTRHHTTVHLHANNCCGLSLIEGIAVPTVIELTLLRNDRSQFTPSHEPIPGPLDFPSMTDRPDLVLRPFG